MAKCLLNHQAMNVLNIWSWFPLTSNKRRKFAQTFVLSENKLILLWLSLYEQLKDIKEEIINRRRIYNTMVKTKTDKRSNTFNIIINKSMMQMKLAILFLSNPCDINWHMVWTGKYDKHTIRCIINKPAKWRPYAFDWSFKYSKITNETPIIILLLVDAF